MYYVWRTLRLLISDMQFTFQIIINMSLDAATLILPNLEKFDKYGLHFRFLHTSSYISLFFTSSLYLSFCTFTSSFPYLLISDFFLFYFHLFTLLYSVPLFTQYFHYSFYVAVPNTSQNGTD